MADCFVGEIRLFGGIYAPVDWMLCNGAALAIREYQPLYSLIGVTYGGDGVNSFNLPDFRGRAVVGQGQAPAAAGVTTTNFLLGQMGGSETVSLTPAQNAAHTHSFSAVNVAASTGIPTNNMLAVVTPNGQTSGLYMNTTTAGAIAQVADPNFLDYSGGMASGGSSKELGNPHNNMMPFLALNYIICVSGLYPDRP
ncbi:phage tail protein [Oleisolibacter albus]|uniref:phage tail protein n=1 Tax=Oleisolibacter albus TaxID=2171757 RepID=UPI000DF2BEF1|nr:tail fiber protein [Oleisolibacter albus]